MPYPKLLDGLLPKNRRMSLPQVTIAWMSLLVSLLAFQLGSRCWGEECSDAPFEFDFGATEQIGGIRIGLVRLFSSPIIIGPQLVLMDESRREIVRRTFESPTGEYWEEHFARGFDIRPAQAVRFVRVEMPPCPAAWSVEKIELFSPESTVSLSVVQALEDIQVDEGTILELGPVRAEYFPDPLARIPVRWQKNGIDIPGATNATVRTPILRAGMNGDTYTAIFNYQGFETNTAAKITVNHETVPPNLLDSALIFDVITLRFSERMDPESILETSHYELSDGTQVIGVSLSEDGISATLDLSSPPPKPISITLRDLRDFALNLIAPNPTLATPTRRSLQLADIGMGETTSRIVSDAANSYQITSGPGEGDQASFLYEEVTGDFDKKVQLSHIETEEPTAEKSEGGFMVRASLDLLSPGAKIAVLPPSGDNNLKFETRIDFSETPDDSSWYDAGRSYPGVQDALPNLWLRLQRIGNSLFAYVGQTGDSWSLIGEKYIPDLPKSLFLGIYATAQSATSRCTYGFENYSSFNSEPLTPLTLLSTGTLDQKTVGVKFSNPVRSDSALDIRRYHVSQGSIRSVEMGVRGDAVYLNVSGLSNTSYSVTVNGVEDLSGNTIATNSLVKGSYSPWQIVDVGQFVSPSNRPSPGDNPFIRSRAVAVASEPNLEIEIVGGGSGFSEEGDFYHFLYRELTGDFDWIVEVTQQTKANGAMDRAEAGLMARENLYRTGIPLSAESTKSRFIWNVTSAEGSSDFTAELWWRGEEGGERVEDARVYSSAMQESVVGRYGRLTTENAKGELDPLTFPWANRWLRLKREGDEFVCFWSYFGREWEEFSRRTLKFSDSLLVGFAAKNGTASGISEGPSQFAVSSIRNFGPLVPPGLTLSSTFRDGVLRLEWSDASAILQSAPDWDGPWTVHPPAQSPYYPKISGVTFFRLLKK